jgi:hypothetical protein
MDMNQLAKSAVDAVTELPKPQDLGPRPKLAWVPARMMLVDAAYQRTIESIRSQALIQKIAREFSWHHFQPLIVSERRVGGTTLYAIIDGQHRHAAAVLLGIDELPCSVVKLDTTVEEADSFVRVNSDRVPVMAVQLFWSKVAAEDPGALKIKHVCDQAGVTIAKRTKPPNQLAPEETFALGTITKALDKYGAEATIGGLKLLRAAYPDKKGSLRANMIKALAALFALCVPFDQKRLIRMLAEINLVEFERSTIAYRSHFKASAEAATYSAIAALYNRGLLADKRLPEKL